MNKKLIICLLCVLLGCALLFSACSEKAPNDSEIITDESGTNAMETDVPTISETSSSTESESASATETQPTDASQTAAPQTDAPQTNAPQTDAPQTDAPTQPQKTTPPATDAPPAQSDSVDVAAAAASLASKSAMFEEPMQQSSAERGISVFGIQDADVAEASYYAASAAVAEEILIVKAVDEAAASNVLHAMKERQAMQKEDYADYVPKEVPKVENAVIKAFGDTVVYCVASDSAAAEAAVASLF